MEIIAEPFETKGVKALTEIHMTSVVESLKEVVNQEMQCIEYCGKEIATSNPGYLDVAIFIREFYLTDTMKNFEPFKELVQSVRDKCEALTSTYAEMVGSKAYENEEEPDEARILYLSQLQYMLNLVKDLRRFLDLPINSRV